MAVGTYTHKRPTGQKWAKGCHPRKIAVGFDEKQFAAINALANSRGQSFASTVRELAARGMPK